MVIPVMYSLQTPINPMFWGRLEFKYDAIKSRQGLRLLGVIAMLISERRICTNMPEGTNMAISGSIDSVWCKVVYEGSP